MRHWAVRFPRDGWISWKFGCSDFQEDVLQEVCKPCLFCLCLSIPCNTLHLLLFLRKLFSCPIQRSELQYKFATLNRQICNVHGLTRLWLGREQIRDKSISSHMTNDTNVIHDLTRETFTNSPSHLKYLNFIGSLQLDLDSLRICCSLFWKLEVAAWMESVAWFVSNLLPRCEHRRQRFRQGL